MKGSRKSGAILISVGAGVALGVLLVLQSLVGTGLLSAKTVTSTTTVTSTLTVPDAYDQVSGSYSNYLSSLNSQNIPEITSEYERNATIEYAGVAPGLVGNYTGSLSIAVLLGVLLARNVPGFFVSNETHTIGPEGSNWVVNSTFDFGGNSTRFGVMHGVIAARYMYDDTNGTWLIARQTWNFIEYNLQYPVE